MNDNIRQIAERVAEESKTYCVHPIETDSETFEFFAEVFAGYLLEESIKVMTKHDYHGEWLGEKLKEHFGVK